MTSSTTAGSGEDNEDDGLDYQLELEKSKRHMERKQATDWIVDIVCKNIMYLMYANFQVRLNIGLGFTASGS